MPHGTLRDSLGWRRVSKLQTVTFRFVIVARSHEVSHHHLQSGFWRSLADGDEQQPQAFG
jgi:hypothetical protein